jgi:hypothetical protein
MQYLKKETSLQGYMARCYSIHFSALSHARMGMQPTATKSPHRQENQHAAPLSLKGDNMQAVLPSSCKLRKDYEFSKDPTRNRYIESYCQPQKGSLVAVTDLTVQLKDLTWPAAIIYIIMFHSFPETSTCRHCKNCCALVPDVTGFRKPQNLVLLQIR